MRLKGGRRTYQPVSVGDFRIRGAFIRIQNNLAAVVPRVTKMRFINQGRCKDMNVIQNAVQGIVDVIRSCSHKTAEATRIRVRLQAPGEAAKHSVLFGKLMVYSDVELIAVESRPACL